jgi:GDSL-like lipase/acylhydrolase family protein
MGGHVALLGDSILDNRAYVGAEPSVVTQLRALLPADWRASLFAVDGSTTTGLAPQLARVPADVTHLVISIGGNDAILNSDLLGLPVSSSAEALIAFGGRINQFETAYRGAIDAARALSRNTTLCTIYNGNLSPAEAPLARIALMVFNDVILRVAFERHLGVIDLRLICTEAADYANPIEPSACGGQKIAAAIARSVGVLNEPAPHSRVYSG